MKEYSVTVAFGPETLSVRAKNEDEAKRRAVWMIGLAGFQQLGTIEVKYAPQGVASTI